MVKALVQVNAAVVRAGYRRMVAVAAPDARAFPHKRLLAIAGVALLIRAVWMALHGQVIENEGAEYARIAENLLAGNGYVGGLGGPQTLFPPLFPLLIGLLSKLTGSSEWAARLISCGAGVATIWPAYGITRLLAGGKSALVAAILVCGDGLLIALSGSTYSESLFFLILLSAFYVALLFVAAPTLRGGIASGLLFGLAYLVRPDAALYPALLAALTVAYALWQRRAWARTIGLASLPLLVTLLVASPYIAWLSLNSGYFRWEGKTLTNSLIAQRMIDGQSYLQATRGLGPDAEPVGVYLVADQFSFKSDTSASAALALNSLAAGLAERSWTVLEDMARDWTLGGSISLGLAGLGVAWALMTRNRVEQWLFLSAGALYLLILCTMHHRWARHLYPFVAFSLPWVACGAVTAGELIAAGAAKALAYATAGRSLASAASEDIPRSRDLAANGLTFLLAAVIVWRTIASVAYSGEFTQSSAVELKDAGVWMAQQMPPARVVMGTSGVPAYYAHSVGSYLPWADEARALRYIHAHPPDFIVLQSDDRSQAPYMAKWLEDGIPDPCALRRRAFPQAVTPTLFIYEWSCR